MNDALRAERRTGQQGVMDAQGVMDSQGVMNHAPTG